MRVAVVSHSCVVDMNQQVLVALRQVENTEVGLLVPANWISDINGEALTPKFLPDVDFPVWAKPVVKPGHVTFHCYRSLPWKELKEFKPEVILSSQEPWSLSGLQAMWMAKKLGIPFLFQTNQNIYKNYPPPFKWIEQASYKAVATALAYSEEARQVLLQKGFTGNSTVVPYATDVSRFQPTDSSELRKSLGLTGATMIGYMGRLVPEKGLDTLIDALKLCDEKRGKTDVKLLFVGAGPEDEKLRAQAEAAGIAKDRLVFTGVVPHREAGRYMACMDIFVLPSRTMPNWKEQFGRVIIEAMACGVPVVGSDSGQIPHLIRDTEGGLVFHEGDAADMADKLTQLLDNPAERARLAARGGAAVKARYTCEAVAAHLHALLAAARDRRPMATTPVTNVPGTASAVPVSDQEKATPCIGSEGT